ncbi:hypothetical protein EON63_08330 [archaeon]|nr:MAG: hypothetical protein EON63_08330 [archaeon]
MRDRVEVLEKQQALNNEKFKQRAKELKATVTKELEEATLDAAGLRRYDTYTNRHIPYTCRYIAAHCTTQHMRTLFITHTLFAPTYHMHLIPHHTIPYYTISYHTDSYTSRTRS